MTEIISLTIQILIGNPLTVSLVILGVACIVLSIIGKIPPVNIEGVRAVILAGFGLFLITMAVFLATILTPSKPALPTPLPIATYTPFLSSPTNIVQPANTSQPAIELTDTPFSSQPIIPTAVVLPTNTIHPDATQIPFISIQSNLLRNSGFENIKDNDLPSDWTYDQRHKVGLDTVSMISYDGSRAFCSRQNLAENESKGWVGFGQDISVQSGQNYGFGGWVYLKNAIAFHVHIEWYTSNGQFIDWDQFTPAYGYHPDGETSNGWIYVQGTKTVPPNASLLRLGLWHGVVNDMVNAPNSFFCADNLELGLLK